MAEARAVRLGDPRHHRAIVTEISGSPRGRRPGALARRRIRTRSRPACSPTAICAPCSRTTREASGSAATASACCGCMTANSSPPESPRGCRAIQRGPSFPAGAAASGSARTAVSRATSTAQFQHMEGPTGTKNARVRAIVEDRRRAVLGWHGRRRRLSPGSGRRDEDLRPRSGLSGDTVTALLQDRAGRIWVGTNRRTRPDRARPRDLHAIPLDAAIPSGGASHLRGSCGQSLGRDRDRGPVHPRAAFDAAPGRGGWPAERLGHLRSTRTTAASVWLGTTDGLARLARRQARLR